MFESENPFGDEVINYRFDNLVVSGIGPKYTRVMFTYFYIGFTYLRPATSVSSPLL